MGTCSHNQAADGFANLDGEAEVGQGQSFLGVRGLKLDLFRLRGFVRLVGGTTVEGVEPLPPIHVQTTLRATVGLKRTHPGSRCKQS